MGEKQGQPNNARLIAELQAVAWKWTEDGSDTDGDPKRVRGTYGDYEVNLTLSRRDRLWSAVVNRGNGKSGFATEGEAKAYAVSITERLLAARMKAARRSVALYAHPSPTPAADADRVRSGVYVASRASIPARGQMWRDLRASGVQVNATWIDEDGPGETADFAELWPRIQREVQSSAGLICYLEPDDFPVKGVLIEIGMALASGIPVVIVAPNVQLDGRAFRPIGSWIKHPLASFADTVTEALAALKSTAAQEGGLK